MSQKHYTEAYLKPLTNWTNLNKEVENCVTCNKQTGCKNYSNSLIITDTSKAPIERINLYILEIPTRNYILVVIDEFSKFTQAYPL